jgi:hypothetical protein
MATIGDRGEQCFADPSDGRREELARLRRLRAPLFDSPLVDDQQDTPHLLSSTTDLGVAHRDGYSEFSPTPTLVVQGRTRQVEGE